MIGDEGVKEIAEALKHKDCKLECLSLKSNDIWNIVLNAIVEALIGFDSCSKLKHLDSSENNKIDQEYIENVWKY